MSGAIKAAVMTNRVVLYRTAPHCTATICHCTNTASHQALPLSLLNCLCIHIACACALPLLELVRRRGVVVVLSTVGSGGGALCCCCCSTVRLVQQTVLVNTAKSARSVQTCQERYLPPDSTRNGPSVTMRAQYSRQCVCGVHEALVRN